ncbi:hypothetical protein SSBG_06487 [Streptomyces sp. SPB074]|nr:hypothetical protein SSBG_06487 [Streptomyces sp. SPB074]
MSCAKIAPDDKPPPQRRGGPGGRRVPPPPGRQVDTEWIGGSGGPEHGGSGPATGAGPWGEAA